MDKIHLETKVEDVATQAGSLLRSRYGLWVLGGLSFLESALPVPLVTDPFLVAYILADRRAAIKGVLVTLAASILGGVFAYLVAFAFYELIATKYLVGSAGEQFYLIVDDLKRGTFVVTLLGAVTPIPYTIVAAGAGFVKGNFLLFVLASIIGRGGRYVIVGFLSYHFGEKAMAMIRKRVFIVSIITIILAVLYILYTLN